MEKAVNVLNVLEKSYPNVKYYLDFKTPVDLLVAAILSAQVRDEVVNECTKELFKQFKSADDYANASVSDLMKYVSKVSFAGNKAKNIISACKILVSKHNGKVPKTIDELTELPGVGRKTANVILQNAYEIVVGIPCDTHVLRVAYRLGWTRNTNPDKVEKDLMSLLENRWWDRVPKLLKAHGRAVCQAPAPYCSKCPVSKLCPKQGVKKSF